MIRAGIWELVQEHTAKAVEKHPHLLSSLSLYEGVSILTEEVGEVAQALNDKNFTKAKEECYDTVAVLLRLINEIEKWEN